MSLFPVHQVSERFLVFLQLENVITSRKTKILSLEERINDIVDLIYKKFSESVGVKNIREYEENHLKAIEQIAAERFNLHNQQSKLKYQYVYAFSVDSVDSILFACQKYIACITVNFL